MTIIIKINLNYDKYNLIAKSALPLVFEGSAKEYPHGKANHSSYDPNGIAAHGAFAVHCRADD
jgi:hypothetical protein